MVPSLAAQESFPPTESLFLLLSDLYTSIVLPVPHGLLEEGLVHPAEVGVDLVGNDCEVPDTLRPGGGGALVP